MEKRAIKRENGYIKLLVNVYNCTQFKLTTLSQLDFFQKIDI